MLSGTGILHEAHPFLTNRLFCAGHPISPSPARLISPTLHFCYSFDIFLLSAAGCGIMASIEPRKKSLPRRSGGGDFCFPAVPTTLKTQKRSHP